MIINVIGTVNLRPFLQSFLLGQQGQKKYYVESDAFQYIDKFFVANTEKEKTTSSTGHNGHASGANGKDSKSSKTEQPKEQSKPAPPKQQTPKKAEDRIVKQDTPKSVEKEVAKTPQKPQLAQQPPQQRAPVPEPVQEQPKVQKTWANLVGGGGKSQPPQQQSYGQGQRELKKRKMIGLVSDYLFFRNPSANTNAPHAAFHASATTRIACSSLSATETVAPS